MPGPVESPPPARIPSQALRRIDWLALAPWLVILRAPSAVIGWPLVIGAVASVSFGAPLRWDPLRQAIRAGIGLSESGSWAPPAISIVGWALTAVVLGSCCAVRMLDWPGRPGVASLWGAARVGKRLVVAVLLLSLVAGFLSLGLLAFRELVAATSSFTSVGSALYGPAALLLATPLALVVGLATAGAPLLIAAIALDDADAFDAISRTVAYTFQRPLTLGFCVLFACLVGCSCAVIIESLIAVVPTVFTTVGIPLPTPKEDALGSASLLAFDNALRGFYPAYAFTAGSAIYLVMRQAIDGQPFDEHGPIGDQSSAA